MRALKPEKRFDRLGERTKALLLFGFGQKRMVDREEFVPGLMHVFIFAAFLAVQLRSGMLYVMGFSKTALEILPNTSHPFWVDHATLARVYEGYLAVKDFGAGAAVIGVTYFYVLRFIVKPDRLTKSWEAILILSFIGGLMVTEFIFGASAMRAQNIEFFGYEPVTS